ncbi:MAG: enoyl-CoA hydratase [Betaproteobacteria bacterium RIFCSPLOWO2_02_FULL_67_26]|nr:MAG: enoyl-CoA hydratase [Betaproteobacteria bacterium RIFCSPLOWO2_02_FULL_67_26]
MPDPIVVTRDGAVATVALNNPERLNALNRAMWAGLGEIMRALSADDGLRCIVVRGAGEKAFAAGADIAEFATERAASKPAKRYGKLVHETMRAVARCRHPTVALIRGACVGGGLEIAAMCDLRIAGQSSRFGIPVNKLGLTMAYGELMGLLALSGRAVALEILLEGRVFDAGEAYRKGLVNRVVADDKVEAEAYATARRIAEGAPLVNRWHKQYIERLAVTARLSKKEWDEGYACFDTSDYKEGVAAFMGKRKPDFKGR